MKAIIQSVIIRSLALLLSVSVAFAQDRPAFKQEELDRMLAPIALYPDSMLSQILMASTYPLEVVQASRWSRANPHLKGQDAVRAVEPMDWDPSVKSLVAFPQILHRMDERLDWTQRLGEAFLAQEPQVMETIQGLRQRAAAAGNLRSNDQIRVARQDEHIIIEPAHPQVVYVPYYDPVDAYGPWWWPAYPPVFWGPPPGYYVAPVHAPAFIWGSGIVIGTGFFFGHFNWHHRHVTVVHKHVLVTRHTTFDRRHTNVTSNTKPVAWEHNPHHRRGVPFRNAAARERFGQIRADTRRDAVRNDAQAMRRLEDTRTADIRQSRLDERRNAVQDRREDRRDSVQVRRDERRDAVQERREDRREATVNRITPGDAHRPDRAVSRNDERVRPAAQPETRDVQPKVVTPVIRTDPRPGPARSEPRPDPRPAAAPVIRTEARPDPRPAVIRSEPRPDPWPAAVPVIRSEARSAVAAPVVRAEPRPNPRPAAPAANTHANPRQVFEGGGRAEARNDGDRGHASQPATTTRQSAPASRPSAGSGNPPPRMGGGTHRGDGGAFRQRGEARGQNRFSAR